MFCHVYIDHMRLRKKAGGYECLKLVRYSDYRSLMGWIYNNENTVKDIEKILVIYSIF